MTRPYDLASITALICFEAAARHLSFKVAAQEINVTPAAVSHQIKALELDLGCSLFIRRHRGVELTEKGAFLLVALQRGFETVSAAVTQLRERPQPGDVGIRVTTAVSALWLTPKITAFWRAHPDVPVSQMVSDLPDAGGAQDLAIGYMPAETAGFDTLRLFGDRIMAVGTRRFAAEHGVRGLADLARVPLIHTSDEANQWTGWDEWFAALDCPPTQGRGVRVNNHMIALQLAQDDVGAVLAWQGLMPALLADGRLVRLVDQDIASPVPFCIRLHPRASAAARRFAAWLMRDAGLPEAQPQ